MASIIRDLLSEKLELHGAYQRFFSTHDGQVIMRHLMKVGHVTVPCACKDRDQALRNEGMQHLILSILTFAKKSSFEITKSITQTIGEKEYD